MSESRRASILLGGQGGLKVHKHVHDPFRAPSAVLYWKSCVIWEIWGSLAIIAAWTTFIVLLDQQIEHFNLSIPTTLLTIIGTVIGFVISYRTSSAYERYGEGRKLWSTIILSTRTLSRMFWLHTETSSTADDEQARAMIEKKTAINLLEGFAVALKHYLRGEHGIYYEDLFHHVCFLPKYSIPSSIPPGDHRLDIGGRSPEPAAMDSTGTGVSGTDEAAEKVEGNAAPSSLPRNVSYTSSVDQTRSKLHDPLHPPQPLAPAYCPPKGRLSDQIPVLSIFKSIYKGTMNATGQRRRKHRYERLAMGDNLPLEIIVYLDAYVAALMRRKSIDAPTMTACLNGLLSMSDALTGLERILTTPLPFGYSVHLKIVIWGYIAFLPFQLVDGFKYITIPAVTLVAFAFLGFLHIGAEIENPFGYDLNDLDLDHFCCNIISKELAEITAHPPPVPEDFVFSSANMPLLPKSTQSALAMSRAHISASDLQRDLRQRANREEHDGGEA